MPRLLSTRRGSSALTLRVRSADEFDESETPSSDPPSPQLPWYAAGALAGAAAAAGGWLLLCGLVVLIWLTARSGAVLDAVGAGTQVWLLANGAGLELAGQRWTLTPLTLTVLLGLLVAQGSAHTARQGVRADVAAGVRHEPADRFRIVRNVTSVTAVGYAAVVTVTASIVGSTDQGVRALVGSLLLGLVAGYLGAARAVGHRLSQVLPAWARPVPAAVGLALAVMTTSGLAVLVTALVLGFGRVQTIAAGLGSGVLPAVLMILAQVLFLPNLVLWGGSWALGAGFRFGEGSLISPRNTDLGLLPSIPILGAMPGEGAGSPWSLCWLASGALAGGVAAYWVMRRRPRARFDETAVVGGLSGILAGLAFAGLAALSRGDLGTDRLRGIGPRLTELAVMSGALMGITGLAVGLIWGLVRRPGALAQPDEDRADGDDPTDSPEEPDPAEEPTVAVEDPEFEDQPSTEESVEDPDAEDQPSTEESVEGPDAEDQPSTEEPVGDPGTEDQPSTEEPTVAVEERTEVIASPRRRWNPFSRR